MGYLLVYLGINGLNMGLYGYMGLYSTKFYCSVLYYTSLYCTVMSVCIYANISIYQYVSMKVCSHVCILLCQVISVKWNLRCLNHYPIQVYS